MSVKTKVMSDKVKQPILLNFIVLPHMSSLESGIAGSIIKYLHVGFGTLQPQFLSSKPM